MPTMEELDKGFTLGEWEVLPKQGVLRRKDAPDDEPLRPENLVMQVLLALAMRDRDVVTQDELIDEVWGGRAQSNEPLQRCIALLRRHFGDTRPYEYIENLPRRGYRVLKPVELHEKSGKLSDEPQEPDTDTRRWKIVGALMLAGFIAIAMIAGSATDVWWGGPSKPMVRSIAILPMDNLSGDPDKQYIVVGTQNILAVRLSELPDFAIKNVKQIHDGDPTEISGLLNVESLLFGSLQMQGDRLKVSWLIVRGADNVTIGSGEVTGTLDGLFALQEQLAKAVRSELAGSKTPQLVTRPVPASAAYNSFMRGMYLLERRGVADNLEAAMALFQESISADENFGPAYLALANGYALLPDYRNLPLEETRRLAMTTVEAGVAADRSIEDAAASIYGLSYHQQKRWPESEQKHLQAVNAAVVDANSFNWYSRMLSSVGRREDSLKWILAAEDIDPDNPIVINRIALAHLWLDETEKAEEYFHRAGDLGFAGRYQALGYALLLMRLDRFEQAEALASADAEAQNTPADWVAPVFAAFADPADPTLTDRALDVLGRQWADETVPPEVVLIARTKLGDIDGAMEIAQLLEQPGEIFEMDLLFIPVLEPLRKHPDFIPLMEKLGVVAYWESVGCEWKGSQVSCKYVE